MVATKTATRGLTLCADLESWTDVTSPCLLSDAIYYGRKGLLWSD